MFVSCSNMNKIVAKFLLECSTSWDLSIDPFKSMHDFSIILNVLL